MLRAGQGGEEADEVLARGVASLDNSLLGKLLTTITRNSSTLRTRWTLSFKN